LSKCLAVLSQGKFHCQCSGRKKALKPKEVLCILFGYARLCLLLCLAGCLRFMCRLCKSMLCGTYRLRVNSSCPVGLPVVEKTVARNSGIFIDYSERDSRGICIYIVKYIGNGTQVKHKIHLCVIYTLYTEANPDFIHFKCTCKLSHEIRHGIFCSRCHVGTQKVLHFWSILNSWCSTYSDFLLISRR
jgi:hypothetical protein